MFNCQLKMAFMLKTFVNIFKVPELRNKVLFTLFMLAIYRIGYWVPIPGVDQLQMADQMHPGTRAVVDAENHLKDLKNQHAPQTDIDVANAQLDNAVKDRDKHTNDNDNS